MVLIVTNHMIGVFKHLLLCSDELTENFIHIFDIPFNPNNAVKLGSFPFMRDTHKLTNDRTSSTHCIIYKEIKLMTDQKMLRK